MSNMHLFLTGALAIIVLIGALRFKALRHLKDRQNKLQRKEELKQKQDSELRERATKFESIAASMVKDIVEGNSPLPSVKTTSRKEPLKNRILPDNRTEMRVFLNDIARDAIYFPRVFPPVHPMTSLNFFGGQPIGPANFHWPNASDRNPMLFLGQLDLSTLPVTDITEKLPPEGVIYFFSRYDRDAQEGKLIYHADPNDHGKEVPQPENIPATHSENLRWNNHYAGAHPVIPEIHCPANQSSGLPRFRRVPSASKTGRQRNHNCTL